jgi:hypothetical protein
MKTPAFCRDFNPACLDLGTTCPLFRGMWFLPFITKQSRSVKPMTKLVNELLTRGFQGTAGWQLARATTAQMQESDYEVSGGERN